MNEESTVKQETRPKSRRRQTSRAAAEPKAAPARPQDLSGASFALDIGTRSIVGLLGIMENGIYRVLDSEQVFHDERAMRDGQIEDIELVSKKVKSVKEALEKRNGLELKSVSIAAAGRTLKTKRVIYEQDLDPTEEISPRLTQAIEYCALGLAQSEFTAENLDGRASSFFCVGYSVISYSLDGYKLSRLAGHVGSKVQLELIAAFLPQNVIQSLYSVTGANGLSVENLTLEPIAAINVVVPKDVQLLNIALVDIGAGTSDIAISKNGSIVAYDMVTVAGDEISEAIMQKCLVDFATAESIKMELDGGDGDVKYIDILGNKQSEKKSILLRSIRHSISALASSIAERIIKINEVAPMAVFLVGGGSKMPGLCKEVAKYLKLPPSNVAISGTKPFKGIELYSDKLLSPEFITPIGIGSLSYMYKGCDFFSTSVNDKKIMLLNTGSPKVIDALLLSSIKPQSMIGISSRPLVYYLNGERVVKRGESAIPGEIYVNGELASIDTPIRHGDKITAKPAIDGTPVSVKIKDLKASTAPLNVLIDGVDVELEAEFFKNGKLLKHGYSIQHMDKITSASALTLGEIFTQLNMDIDLNSVKISINGREAEPGSLVENGDIITTGIAEAREEAASSSSPAPSSLPEADTEASAPTGGPDAPASDAVSDASFDKASADKAAADTESSEKQADDSEKTSGENDEDNLPPEPGAVQVCLNGKWMDVETPDKNKFFFFDMLNYVDIDPQKPQGDIVLMHNGSPASYTAKVKDGDIVEIRWSDI